MGGIQSNKDNIQTSFTFPSPPIRPFSDAMGAIVLNSFDL
jgi:hypothetical protein